MPGLGSPTFDRRSPMASLSSMDRELTLNGLTSHKNRSSLLGDKSGLHSDRFNIPERSSFADRSSSSLLDKGVFSDRPISGRTSSLSPDHTPNLKLGGTRSYGGDLHIGSERSLSGERKFGKDLYGDRPPSGEFRIGKDRSVELERTLERKPSSYGLGRGLDESPPSGRGSDEQVARGRPRSSQEKGDSGRRRSSLLREGKGQNSGGLLATLTDRLEEEELEKSRGNGKNKKKKRKNPVSANLSGTRYEVVRQMADHMGFTIMKDDDPNAYLLWNDSFVSTDRISEMKPFQRINHFPGMGEICRKDCLARNMAKMAKAHPEEFNFVPKTWILPTEYNTFQNYAREMKKKKKNKVFILKPSNGAMGNGISLCKNPEKIPQNDNYIVQEYLDKPFLIDGYKCDMRIYVLVTCCDPLRIFLFEDGLLRMSTERYTHPTDQNIEQLYMHLTNYSVNKHNEHYDKSGHTDTGSKRTLKFFNDYLRKNDIDVAYLWRNITEMIVKTLIVAHPHVLHSYRMCRPGQPPGSDSVCFEILGFDVMVDRKLRPWLLEINRSPSFGTDEKLDYDIKSGVIEDTLRLLNIRASDKRKNLAAQKAQAQKRLLRPTKRVEHGDASELEKKRQSVEKKKEELKDTLTRMRKDTIREEHENRYSGRFKRIFPPEDKFRREKYTALLSDAYGTFMSGRGSTLQQEIQRTYNNMLSEEDILDMLAQCEADEKEGKTITNRPPRGPKPLQSMPTLERDAKHPDDDDEEDDEEDEDTETGPTRGRSWGRPTSGKSASGRPGQKNIKGRALSASRQRGNEMIEQVMSTKEWEEETAKQTLLALNDMRIKFPGKSDDEADYLLDKLHENWKFHKPRIASYWLVKLDSIKRRKVIDIVRSNVRAVLQKTWKTSDIDGLRLYRIVNRVFNRLLWSHGQGLWNCFQEAGGSSWETIFNKSSESVSHVEMGCCRRVVQLCRDCLLIVYQFAADAKSAATVGTGQESHVENSRRDSVTPRVNGIEKNPSSNWNPSNPISQRVSRLYHSRSQSLNSLHGPS